MVSMGGKVEQSRASSTRMQTRTRGLYGTKRNSSTTSRILKTKIPGTIMVFLGIKDEAEANNLWAYLKQFDAEGKKK